MKNPYLNLVFAVFISVIASSSFVIGFFVGGYSMEKTQEEKEKSVEKYWEAANLLVNSNASTNLYDIYRNFEYKLHLLKQEDPRVSKDYVLKTKKDLLTQVESMECMLAKISDADMRNKLKEKLLAAKPYLTN